MNILLLGQMPDGFVELAQLARIPLVILPNIQTQSCDLYNCRGCGIPVTIGSCRRPPTKIRRPRHCGLPTCDSERYVDIVNSQVSLLESKSLS